MRHSTLSLALAALMSLAAVPAHAFVEANVAGGYTILNPSDFNSALSKGATNVTEVKSGFYVSADVGIAMLPFLKLDPRVSAVFANQATATFGATKFSADASIVPMELGLTADIAVPLSGFSARAGIWGGYGLATVATTSETGGLKTGNLYQGSAFTAEALAAARFSLVPFLSLSLEAGYRLANVAQLSDTGGKVWQSGGKDLAYDFSGVNLGGGLTFSF